MNKFLELDEEFTDILINPDHYAECDVCGNFVYLGPEYSDGSGMVMKSFDDEIITCEDGDCINFMIRQNCCEISGSRMSTQT